MAGLPSPVLQLMKSLRLLPGVGSRSAERMALRLAIEKKSWPEQLANDILQVRKTIRLCPECGFLSVEDSLCEICADSSRDRSTICVVEGPIDVLNIERAGIYKGLYHCLGGKISPLNDVSFEDLTVEKLLSRASNAIVQEVIIALGSDVEGETTTLQLAEELKKLPLKLSRLAQGISVGTGLEHHDPATVAHAIALRRPL